MNIDWQQAIAIILVALAASYVGWRAWHRFFSKGGCGTCAGCSGVGARQAMRERTIVPIESLTPEPCSVHCSNAHETTSSSNRKPEACASPPTRTPPTCG